MDERVQTPEEIDTSSDRDRTGGVAQSCSRPAGKIGRPKKLRPPPPKLAREPTIVLKRFVPSLGNRLGNVSDPMQSGTYSHKVLVAFIVSESGYALHSAPTANKCWRRSRTSTCRQISTHPDKSASARPEFSGCPRPGAKPSQTEYPHCQRTRPACGVTPLPSSRPTADPPAPRQTNPPQFLRICNPFRCIDMSGMFRILFSPLPRRDSSDGRARDS